MGVLQAFSVLQLKCFTLNIIPLTAYRRRGLTAVLLSCYTYMISVVLPYFGNGLVAMI